MLEILLRKRLPEFFLDVSLRVGPGVTVLFGPSGSGKSMTLHAVAGLVRPDAGRIIIGDRVLFDSETGINLPPQQRRVGFVMQDYALFPHMTVAENIAYGLTGRPKPERAQAVADMVRLMELEGLEARRPAQLSGGQQQRVAIARALVAEPKLVLADEPTGNLDTRASDEIASLLRQVANEWGRSVVMVTHDAHVASYADRIVFLRDGRIVDESRTDPHDVNNAAEVAEKIRLNTR